MMKRFFLLCLILIASYSVSLTQDYLTQPIHHNGARIRGIVYSSDSQRILSWGGETARIWDVVTGEILLEIAPKPQGIPAYPGGGLTSARWNEDETHIIVNYQRGSHSVFRSMWNVATGELVSGESSTICTGSCGFQGTNTAWVNETSDQSGERIAQWDNESCSENCVYRVTLVETDGTSVYLDHEQRIKHAYWSDSGRYLATTLIPDCSQEDSCHAPVSLWDINPQSPHYGDLITNIEAPCLVWDIQWTEDEAQFFVQSDSWWRQAFAGGIDFCHATWQSVSMTGELLWQYTDPYWTSAFQMTLSENENSLIVLGDNRPSRDMAGQLRQNRAIRLDSMTGDILETQVMNGSVQSADTGTTYAYQLRDDALIIWNVRTLEEVTQLELASPLLTREGGHLRLVPDITWIPEYGLGYALTENKQFYIWDTETWEILLQIEQETLNIQSPSYERPNPYTEGTTHLSIYGYTSDCEASCLRASWLFDLAEKRLEFSMESPTGGLGRIDTINDRLVANIVSCTDCNSVLEVYDNVTEELLIRDEGDPRIQIVEVRDNWLITKALSGYVVPPPPVRHRIWDLETGDLLWEMIMFGYVINPQQNQILIYGTDTTAIHDLMTGEQLVQFDFSAGNRGIWEWSPDGNTIIFRVDGDQVADIYDTNTGEWIFPNRQG